MAWVERPELEDLDRTAGYLRGIGVDQFGERDSLFVQADVYHDDGSSENIRYSAYLDVGTTVALAQLQLLRMAMTHDWAVLIRYLDDSAGTGNLFFYEIEVVPTSRDEWLITEEWVIAQEKEK